MKLYVDRGGQERAIEMVEHMIASYFNINQDQKAVLEIYQDKLTRSQRQNKLWWKWMLVIGNFIGHSQNQMSLMLQQEFLGEETFTNKITGEEITQIRSTKSLKVDEMKELLEQVDFWAGDLGIKLPHPEDLYWQKKGVVCDYSDGEV